MLKTADSPIKVYPETKDKLRHAASLMDCTQAELVGRAVDEYVERHRKLFAQRMDEAQRALLGGKAAALAHFAGCQGDRCRTRRRRRVQSSRQLAQAQARDLKPGELTGGPARTRLRQLRAGGVEDHGDALVALVQRRCPQASQ